MTYYVYPGELLVLSILIPVDCDHKPVGSKAQTITNKSAPDRLYQNKPL